MQPTRKADEQLDALAAHLAERRSAILRAWRKRVDADPLLTAPASLPRTQFNDHIPDLLDNYARRLRTWPREESAASREQRKEDASGHGLQRWQQGYHLREVTREWAHLQLCLADELAQYAVAHPGLEAAVMPAAWRALSELCSQGVSESTAQYFHFQQIEAEGHVRDLEKTLAQAQELERRRAELLQQAAHDLRGQVGVVKTATWGMTKDGVPEGLREEFFRLLQGSVTSLHAMLDDVMDLVRLQAGHETRSVAPFDAAVALRELCERLRPLAAERDLVLTWQGPATLHVRGDAVKTLRIAQNLLLNALKYTNEGGVEVSWGPSRDNDPERWMLCVSDTGPGFHAGPGAPLAGALQEATNEAKEVERKAHSPADPRPEAPALPVPDGRPIHQERGEGIGLSIVKRLCEMLDATVELESEPGEGATFRVVFPRRYD